MKTKNSGADNFANFPVYFGFILKKKEYSQEKTFLV